MYSPKSWDSNLPFLICFILCAAHQQVLLGKSMAVPHMAQLQDWAFNKPALAAIWTKMLHIGNGTDASEHYLQMERTRKGRERQKATSYKASQFTLSCWNR